MSTFLFYGIANVGTGLALLFNPNAIYHSFLARLVNQKTGFHLTDVNTAPGFNNAVAVMTIAVGAGAIRAGLTGSRTAQSCIALMSVVWTVGTIATCIVSPHTASATHFFSAINHTVLSTVLITMGGFSIPELVGLGQERGKSKSKRRQSRG